MGSTSSLWRMHTSRLWKEPKSQEKEVWNKSLPPKCNHFSEMRQGFLTRRTGKRSSHCFRKFQGEFTSFLRNSIYDSVSIASVAGASCIPYLKSLTSALLMRLWLKKWWWEKIQPLEAVDISEVSAKRHAWTPTETTSITASILRNSASRTSWFQKRAHI